MVKSPGCSFRDPEFNAQHPCGSQPSITVVSWDKLTSSGVRIDVHVDKMSIHIKHIFKKKSQQLLHPCLLYAAVAVCMSCILYQLEAPRRARTR